ncbi:MAG: pilus assembly protein N-terminal domain-containing protein [Proteobacteria bacterium]|nr:pilus assembly protein N-terminal domain-containing protein [Pseudomonadota bacterium]
MRNSKRGARGARMRVVALGLAGLMAYGATAAAQDALGVNLDRATITKLPDRVATIVVGNPLIADVSIQSGGLLVVTGKGYGVTNLVAFDRGGNILMDTTVTVRGPTADVVVVYRGVERESYSCSPTCERRVTLGDTPEFFNAALAQSGSRIGQAQGGAGQSTQR